MTVDQVASAASVPADEALLGATAGELDQVEATLERLENGDFDSCEVCGGRIGLERLERDPLLTRCPAHSEADATGGPGTAPEPVAADRATQDPAVSQPAPGEPVVPAGAGSEGPVAVFATDQPLAFGGQQSEG